MASVHDSRTGPNLDTPPAGYFLVVPPPGRDEDADAIDLGRIMAELRAHWKLLLCMFVLGAGLAAGIAFQLRNVYKARVIVAPTAESNEGGLKKELGGIAELAGIDIGTGSGRKVEALAVLNSKGFVRQFIMKNNLLPILYAERWDDAAKTWRKGAKPPTMEIAVKRFMGRRTIDENTKSGLVTIDFVWYSPDLAAQWANGMIEMVNQRMRETDIHNAESSLDYLNRELPTANTVELHQAIAHLIEKQEDNKMVASVQKDYAYHYIDSAIPPEAKSGPFRSLIIAAGGALGFMLGVLIVIYRRRAAKARRESPC
jgi:uncharacterized protein involved in exopolysaccharide biosynthesis